MLSFSYVYELPNIDRFQKVDLLASLRITALSNGAENCSAVSGVASPSRRLMSAVTNDSYRSSERFPHSILSALGIHLLIPSLGLTGCAGPTLAELSEKGSISEKGSVSGRVAPS